VAETYIHSIDAFTVTFAGILIDGGGASDGFVEIELPQRFDSTSGVQGDVVTYKMGNNVATVRINLLKEASVNEDLFALHREDWNSESGSGIGDFILEDLNTGIEYSGEARIIQAPTLNVQAESQSWQWTLQLFQPSVDYNPRGVVV
jgi:hypothetical protein